MKIDINQIPIEGLTLREDFTASGLDLETELFRFNGPIKAEAKVSRITNAVTVKLAIRASLHTECSRCITGLDNDFSKEFTLNYPADSSSPIIELDPEIREEIIIDYPMKPLCRPDCKGLCPKCGKNLNEGKCGCVIERS